MCIHYTSWNLAFLEFAFKDLKVDKCHSEIVVTIGLACFRLDVVRFYVLQMFLDPLNLP